MSFDDAVQNRLQFLKWMDERERRGWTPLLPEHPEAHWVEVFCDC